MCARCPQGKAPAKGGRKKKADSESEEGEDESSEEDASDEDFEVAAPKVGGSACAVSSSPFFLGWGAALGRWESASCW